MVELRNTSGRDWRLDAALRPQPKRDGPDDWTTPACLCRALLYILSTLPPGPGLDPAPGDGALIMTIQDAGRQAILIGELDFLVDAVPVDLDPNTILVINPPFNRHSAFIERALRWLDDGVVQAVIVLFRHDHLQSESREPPHCLLEALRRSTQLFICPWRPTWIPGTTGNGRWSNTWVLWLRGAEPQRPVWLKRRA
jgi:hypothetical protein